MKLPKLIGITMLCTFLFGCVNRIAGEEEEMREKTISFRTILDVSQVPMRAKSGSISRLVIADYRDGTEVQKIEQSATDAKFGSVSIPLKYGQHELLFVGHNSESATLAYPAVSFDKPTDTFSYYLSINVDESTESTKSITLTRSASLLKIVAKDAIPSDVKSLKIVLSKYYPALNVKSSFGHGDGSALERSFEYKASHIGEKETTYSIYTFTPENGFTTDITISSIDALGNILNKITVENVSIEKNRQTILSGNIFHLSMDTDITIDDQWGANIKYPISQTSYTSPRQRSIAL